MITVKQLIMNSDFETLSNYYLDLFSDDYDKNAVENNLMKCSYKLASTKENISDEYVMVPCRYSDFEDDIYDYLQTEMVRVSDIKDNLMLRSPKENILLEHGEAINIASNLENIPIRYSYSMTSWNDVLGCKVPEILLKENEPEKVAASIIFEMTFYGYEEDIVLKQREELENIAKEVSESIKKGDIKIEKGKNITYHVDKEDEEEQNKISRMMEMCDKWNNVSFIEALRKSSNEILSEVSR